MDDREEKPDALPIPVGHMGFFGGRPYISFCYPRFA